MLLYCLRILEDQYWIFFCPCIIMLWSHNPAFGCDLWAINEKHEATKEPQDWRKPQNWHKQAFYAPVNFGLIGLVLELIQINFSCCVNIVLDSEIKCSCCVNIVLNSENQFSSCFNIVLDSEIKCTNAEYWLQSWRVT